MTADLSTTYLGMPLPNPLVASSSPMTATVDSLVELQDAGVSAVVLPSLWEEQIEHEAMEMQRLYELTSDSFAESLSGYFPEYEDYSTRTEAYLRHLVEAKEALDIPVIASLNGTTRGGWTHYARKIEESGADALELNVYLISTDPYASGPDVEKRYLDLVEAVRAEVTIPLAVKIGPYFSSTPHMVRQLVEAGADGSGVVQPLLPAGHRPRDTRSCAAGQPLAEDGAPAPACDGSGFCAARCRRTSPSRLVCTRLRMP